MYGCVCVCVLGDLRMALKSSDVRICSNIFGPNSFFIYFMLPVCMKL